MDEVHPSLRQRKIVHIDMDAFYASIEILDNPELRGKPIVVGGPPDSRAVVCTASYEARKFGIRSAMPCSRAARLCPQAIFLRPRFERYSEVSRQVRTIMLAHTPILEPVSLDEAYLDVTRNAFGLLATEVARRIQREVFEATGLTCSAGVAPNKLIAKIASDFRKPAGLTVIPPERVRAFVGPLPVRKLSGVGPVTERRLGELGIHTCADAWTPQMQAQLLSWGAYGRWLADAIQGLDDSEVCTHHERKSYGSEETFARDILDLAEIEAYLAALVAEVARGMERSGLRGGSVCVKVKYHDFQSVTRQCRVGFPTRDPAVMLDAARVLLRRTEAGRKRVRLVGISMGGLVKDEPSTSHAPQTLMDISG